MKLTDIPLLLNCKEKREPLLGQITKYLQGDKIRRKLASTPKAEPQHLVSANFHKLTAAETIKNLECNVHFEAGAMAGALFQDTQPTIDQKFRYVSFQNELHQLTGQTIPITSFEYLNSKGKLGVLLEELNPFLNPPATPPLEI